MATQLNRSCIVFLLALLIRFDCRGQTRLDSLRQVVYQIAYSEVGLREPKGRNEHPRILDYHRTVSTSLTKLRPVPPYCASFVNYCFVKAGVKVIGVPNPARARDWFRVESRTVLTQQTLRGNRRMIEMPKRGDVVGYIFSGGAISHVEILDRIDIEEGYIYAVGANTSGANAFNTVNREGDGVYYIRRRIKMFYKIADVLK